jgi:hypothetical protein
MAEKGAYLERKCLEQRRTLKNNESPHHFLNVQVAETNSSEVTERGEELSWVPIAAIQMLR